jgi:hypothetical protein
MGVTSESTKRERKKYKTEIIKCTERKEKREKRKVLAYVFMNGPRSFHERERGRERDWGNPLVIKGFEASERKNVFCWRPTKEEEDIT